jgi:FkbM family methyltransferase
MPSVTSTKSVQGGWSHSRIVAVMVLGIVTWEVLGMVTGLQSPLHELAFAAQGSRAQHPAGGAPALVGGSGGGKLAEAEHREAVKVAADAADIDAEIALAKQEISRLETQINRGASSSSSSSSSSVPGDSSAQGGGPASAASPPVPPPPAPAPPAKNAEDQWAGSPIQQSVDKKCKLPSPEIPSCNDMSLGKFPWTDAARDPRWGSLRLDATVIGPLTGATLIDIGANTGRDSAIYLQRGAQELRLFEPLASNVAALHRTFDGPSGNVRIYPNGLGANDREVKIQFGGKANEAATEIHKWQTCTGQCIDAKIVDVVKALRELPKGTKVFLAMNCMFAWPAAAASSCALTPRTAPRRRVRV